MFKIPQQVLMTDADITDGSIINEKAELVCIQANDILVQLPFVTPPTEKDMKIVKLAINATIERAYERVYYRFQELIQEGEIVEGNSTDEELVEMIEDILLFCFQKNT